VNYANIGKEFLVVVFALKKYSSYLINSKVNFHRSCCIESPSKRSNSNPHPNSLGSSSLGVRLGDLSEDQIRELGSKTFVLFEA